MTENEDEVLQEQEEIEPVKSAIINESSAAIEDATDENENEAEDEGKEEKIEEGKIDRQEKIDGEDEDGKGDKDDITGEGNLREKHSFFSILFILSADVETSMIKNVRENTIETVQNTF